MAIGIGTAVAVLAAGGGVAVLTLTSGAADRAAAQEQVTVLPPDPQAEPPRIKTDLQSVDVAGSGAGGSAELPQRETKPFSLLGVSWSDPKDAPKGDIEVRTRSVKTGKWSAWQTLDRRDSGADGEEAAAPNRRGVTEPLWVGRSDGVAARLGGKGAGLPAGLRLELIDPGSEPGGRGGGEPVPSTSAEAPAPEAPEGEDVVPPPAPEIGADPEEETETGAEPGTGTGTGSEGEAPVQAPPPAKPPAAATSTTTTKPATTTSATTKPTTVLPVPTSTVPIKAQFPSYYSRKSWSADETIVKSVSLASEVKVVFLHHTAHTAKANDYECADAPAIIRAIQSYDVKVDGFSDIGYNYLVDKCGRLYEGRRGGVENAVVPAAIIGFNSGYAHVAVIGNYDTAASNTAIERVVAQLAAARLGKYGYNATSKATVKAGATHGGRTAGERVTLNRLSGHRDAHATACPGKNLYARMTAIRNLSQEMITGMALRSVTGGGSAGGAWYVKSRATLTWSMSTPAARVSRIEVQVDGRTTGTLAGSARAASVNLTPGKHSVVIRAVHTSGSTARLAATIWGDATAPSTPGRLGVSLRTGAVSKSAVPVTFNFVASDNVLLGGYVFNRPKSGSASGTARSWATTVRTGASTYTVTARDAAGNYSRAASVSRSVVLKSEGSATKTGSWTKKTGGGYLGGKALLAKTKNRKLTWKFTGRSAALLFTRNKASGKVAIYLDGKKVKTVDLKSQKTLNRQAVWARDLTYGKHTIEIVVLGTSGRPTVISDGLVYLK
ncbi:N-acetylmuramoyl-L-alanine amidase [Actinoplanes sp. NPDC024001]|uniref:N-acetylmuramoyl-L-alanine amidase n=1 Tax=Actinoplanes sp. NPDC024001 TaxID=3154598 RepID=UPI0033D94662